MTPRMQEMYKDLIYADYDEVEIDQLIVGLLGSRMNLATCPTHKYESTDEFGYVTVTFKVDEDEETEE